MTTILTFGDSNTHGTPPITRRGEAARFGPAHRWPCVMQARLGCALVEEGLPGRTAGALADPVMGPHMSGPLGLRIALQSHWPIDRLTIMLGTNDLKAHFGNAPEMIAGHLAGLLAIAMSEEYQLRHDGFDVLDRPAPVLEQGPIRDVFLGAAARSRALPPLLKALADHWGVGFFDAGTVIGPSEVDGVHFDPEAQVTLGHAIAEALGAR